MDRPSPDVILNKLAAIFEISREHGDIYALLNGIESAGDVDTNTFSNSEKCRLHYFIANAWSYVLLLKYTKPEDIPLSSTEYEKQIYHLRMALTFAEGTEGDLLCQVFTNLGCAFSHVGRFVEALQYFNLALDIKPDFGMALGNKGYGLYRYAMELHDGIHQLIFLQYAYKYLRDSCKDNSIYPEAKYGFQGMANHIEDHFSAETLEDRKTYQDLLAGRCEDDVNYRLWCMDNILFLNPLNDVIEQNIVACDILHTPSMTLKKDEKPIYLSLFNQIKQEYVSARYLFYDGVYNDSPHFSDDDVSLYRVFDMPLYSISIEKVKIAFRLCYSIFDKIAYLLNIYLKLGISNNRVSIRNIWHENGNTKSPVRKDILHNRALQGLYWLSKDLDIKDGSPIEPAAKEIATIRNYIEHKSFKVVEHKNICWDEYPETFEIEQDEFYDKTSRLLKLTRAALIYLSSAIYEEESNRKPLEGHVLPIAPDLL